MLDSSCEKFERAVCIKKVIDHMCAIRIVIVIVHSLCDDVSGTAIVPNLSVRGL